MKLEENIVQYRHTLCAQYMARTNGILHLGANLASEAPTYAEVGKPVLWIEAIPHIHERLSERLKSFPDQKSLCALLGDKDEMETTFHISGNPDGVSSSIYEFGPFGGGSRTLWPELELKMVDHITLPMVRLDTLLQHSGIDPSTFDYWVVDLQGAEKLALMGGINALKTCKAMLIEVSTVEVYQNGVLWPTLSAWLHDKGLIPLWEPAMEHDDVLFVRRTCMNDVVDAFRTDHYVRHNQRRLEHLASLGLDLFNKRVLEVGAGIGDHTTFYLDRGCEVLTSDARPENVLALQERFSGTTGARVAIIDMNKPLVLDESFEIVHCYGLLYHLENPDVALEYLCRHCDGLLVLETCVSYGDEVLLNPIKEPADQFSQAFNGTACRPTRSWVVHHLSRFMPHVYVSRTQPAHPEFPLDWSVKENDLDQLKRAVFVASREVLDNNPHLMKGLPLFQTRL